jgi:hypothetical protein
MARLAPEMGWMYTMGDPATCDVNNMQDKCMSGASRIFDL